jgi:hypothetical protein
MDWARMLAYVTGTVDQELLARNEYLATENRIMKAQLNGRLKLSDAERGALGEIGHRLGRKVLGDGATVARPDPILGWIASSSPTSTKPGGLRPKYVGRTRRCVCPISGAISLTVGPKTSTSLPRVSAAPGFPNEYAPPRRKGARPMSQNIHKRR